MPDGIESRYVALEQRILQNPASLALLRLLFARRLGLPAGPLRVQVQENVRIPMADGVELAANHYLPAVDGSFPTILIRTPYGRGGAGSVLASAYAYQFATHGYHVICQDTRGRFDSGGEFIPFVHEAADGESTIDWIARQPWFNGSLGMWGASYLGYAQWAAAAAGRPELKALVPIIANSHMMRYHEHGFPLDLLLRWMFQLQVVNEPDLPMWERMRRLSNADVQNRYLGEAFMHLPMSRADELAVGRPVPLFQTMAEADAAHPQWQQADLSSIVASAPPAFFVGGWFDIFLDGLLEDFQVQQAAGKRPMLTVGPWYHLANGYAPVAFQGGLDWFATHLRGEEGRLRRKPVRLFVVNSGWREVDRWPPPAVTLRYHLHGSGAAKTGRLLETAAAAGAAPDRYRYDPADPTPNLGGPKMGSDAGQVDNRPLEQRADVLVFSSYPLADDLDVVGPVQAVLYVNSSLTIADFFVRLCDVDRSGRSLNVCDGNFRVDADRMGREPDGSLRITVPMSATAYRFRQGHRIRVQVSSGAHPRFARNLGVAGPQTMATDMLIADQTVYHDADHPSMVELPVMNPT